MFYIFKYLIKYQILTMILLCCLIPSTVSARSLRMRRTGKTYHKKGVHINLYKGKYNRVGGKCIFYAAHVVLEKKAFNKLHLAKANGRRSNGFQTVYQMVHKKNNRAYKAVLAVNGPFNGANSRRWNAFGGRQYYSVSSHNYTELYGWQYAKGSIGANTVGSCATYSGTTGLLRPGLKQEGVKSGMSLYSASKKGLISDTFSGDMGYDVLVDGKIMGTGNKSSLRQRTFVGTNGDAGNFWIVVCNGKDAYGKKADGYSKGLNTYGEGTILKSLGCNYGFNLDGGGSSTMVYLGKTINKQRKLRKCYDALYVGR